MSRRGALPVFLLMALAIFAMAGLAWLSGRNHGDVEEPSSPIQSLVPAEVMTRDRAVLRWSPGPPGTVYEVDVTTTDMKPIARGAGLLAAEFLVPPDAFTGLTPGTSISWRIRATLPDGRSLSSSNFVNTVRKK